MNSQSVTRGDSTALLGAADHTIERDLGGGLL
jgi:hypothetical protein